MNNSTYSISLILTTFVCAALLILCGSALRKWIPTFRKMHLPGSVIGGIVGIIIGPQLLGDSLFGFLGISDPVSEIYSIGKKLPSYLIIVVFAGLMIGKDIPSPKKIFSTSGAHLAVGYGIAWGHYIIGLLLTLLVLMPLFDANLLSSMLIAIGFQGGYGTAAGLGGTYEELGFAEGYDLALGMATAGKVAAILVGLILINIAVKRDQMTSPAQKQKEEHESDVPSKQAEALFKEQRSEKYFSADVLILHFACLCVAIFIGWGLRELLILTESLFLTQNGSSFMRYVPLFPMALIGGIILQVIISKTKQSSLINAHYIHSIGHSFLDILIVVAIATLSLETIAENWVMLLMMIVAGISWNLLACLTIAPKLYKKAPWTRALSDFAHSTGAATTALLLVKISDPADKTGSQSSFTMKQPLYEPIVGGGIITAIALPLLHATGPWITLSIFSGLFLITLILGFKLLHIREKNPIAKR